MLIDIAKLRLQPGSSKQYNTTEELDPLPWNDGLVAFNKPIGIEVTATNTGKSVHVEGKASAELVLKCGRCLQPYTQTIITEFSEEYYPQSKVSTNTGEDGLRTFSGDHLNLTDVILESIYLEIPMRTVCSEQCKGLCPKCGINRNTEQCSCQNEEPDPRLAVLQQIFERGTGKEG